MSRKESPQILYEGKYIRFLKDERWEYVTRNNCTGVVIIVAMTDDERVIFVEQFRPPVGKKVIEFPAGLVNDLNLKRKESFLTAAKRELLEEAGYRAERVEKLMEGPISSGLTSDLVVMVRAYGLKKIHKGGGDQSEMISAVYAIKLKEVDRWLLKMKKKGYLIEPKIYAGLYFLKNKKD